MMAIESFWGYIPHFIHSPLYAYAFGNCLVNLLYAQYEKSSQGFAERYFELLKAGEASTIPNGSRRSDWMPRIPNSDRWASR